MTKFWLIAAVFIVNLSAPASYAMESTEETPLVAFVPEQFWEGGSKHDRGKW